MDPLFLDDSQVRQILVSIVATVAGTLIGMAAISWKYHRKDIKTMKAMSIRPRPDITQEELDRFFEQNKQHFADSKYKCHFIIPDDCYVKGYSYERMPVPAMPYGTAVDRTGSQAAECYAR